MDSKPPSITSWLSGATQQLAQSGISTARLDCLVLLEDCTGHDRSWLLAHDDVALTNEQLGALSPQIEQRKAHVPLAYIRGQTEFYGHTFIITPEVLEPRPESETMIDLFLRHVSQFRDTAQNFVVADVGTGSGAIAVTVKLAVPTARVLAVDIDERCLAVAQENARLLQADIACMHGDLVQPLLATTDTIDPTSLILLCNLPYVPESYQINDAALHEPRIAIFGGTDGLDPYRQLFAQLSAAHVRPHSIFTESLPFQHADLAKLAQEHQYQQATADDFIQLFIPA